MESSQTHRHHRWTSLKVTILSTLMVQIVTAYFIPCPIHSRPNDASFLLRFHKTKKLLSSTPKHSNPHANLHSVNFLYSSNEDHCVSVDEMIQNDNDFDPKNNDKDIENDNDNRPSSEIALGAWVPIGSQDALTGLGPTRVKVMGINLVVWDYDDSKTSDHYDNNGANTNKNNASEKRKRKNARNKDKQKNQNKAKKQWSVLRDVCSHKFAALSQGRVNIDTNCIECPYHGWQFDHDGRLAVIPQMEELLSIESSDENKNKRKNLIPPAVEQKGSVQSYPTHITGDLIWAFLPTSIHGESFPVNILPEEYYYNGLRRDMDMAANFAVVDLPASYDFFMEK